MTEDGIAEIGIDEAGRLFIRPSTQAFPFVYRAAMQIGWDAETNRLLSPPPSDWSRLEWYGQMLRAAADEYGVDLRLSVTTKWSNVPQALRTQIEAVHPQAK